MLLVLIHGRVDVTVGRWHFYIVDKDCSSAEILETDPQQQTYYLLITTLETDPPQQTYYDVLITTLETDPQQQTYYDVFITTLSVQLNNEHSAAVLYSGHAFSCKPGSSLFITLWSL